MASWINNFFSFFDTINREKAQKEQSETLGKTLEGSKTLKNKSIEDQMSSTLGETGGSSQTIRNKQVEQQQEQTLGSTGSSSKTVTNRATETQQEQTLGESGNSSATLEFWRKQREIEKEMATTLGRSGDSSATLDVKEQQREWERQMQETLGRTGESSKIVDEGRTRDRVQREQEQTLGQTLRQSNTVIENEQASTLGRTGQGSRTLIEADQEATLGATGKASQTLIEDQQSSSLGSTGRASQTIQQASQTETPQTEEASEEPTASQEAATATDPDDQSSSSDVIPSDRVDDLGGGGGPLSASHDTTHLPLWQQYYAEALQIFDHYGIEVSPQVLKNIFDPDADPAQLFTNRDYLATLYMYVDLYKRFVNSGQDYLRTPAAGKVAEPITLVGVATYAFVGGAAAYLGGRMAQSADSGVTRLVDAFFDKIGLESAVRTPGEALRQFNEEAFPGVDPWSLVGGQGAGALAQQESARTAAASQAASTAYQQVSQLYGLHSTNVANIITGLSSSGISDEVINTAVGNYLGFTGVRNLTDYQYREHGLNMAMDLENKRFDTLLSLNRAQISVLGAEEVNLLKTAHLNEIRATLVETQERLAEAQIPETISRTHLNQLEAETQRVLTRLRREDVRESIVRQLQGQAQTELIELEQSLTKESVRYVRAQQAYLSQQRNMLQIQTTLEAARIGGSRHKAIIENYVKPYADIVGNLGVGLGAWRLGRSVLGVRRQPRRPGAHGDWPEGID